MILPKFSTIYNLRKASEKLPLYRYAALDHSSQEDLDRFMRITGITCRIDLRSPIEVIRNKMFKDGPSPPVRKTLMAKRILDRNTQGDLQDNVKMTLATNVTAQLRPTDFLRVQREKRKDKEKIVYHEVVSKPSGKVEVYNINFINKQYINNVVWDRCTVYEKLKMVTYMLTFRFNTLVNFVGGKLKEGGLEGSYHDFIDYSSSALCSAMQTLTQSLESGEKVGVNCFFGKDRTGITIALTKYICGDSFDDIIADYAESENSLHDIMESIESEFASQGLPEEFAKTPAQVMRNTFKYIQEKYGSIEFYLQSIGFDSSWQQRLKNTVNVNVITKP